MRGPGEVKLTLAPLTVKGESEACVLLRAVAIRNIQDPHDWYVLGSAVVLKVDTVGKLQQQGIQLSKQQLLEADPVEADARCVSTGSAEDCKDREEAGEGLLYGVPVQTLVDFQTEIQADLERYCTTHRLCAHHGRCRGYHVCMMDPCPYRPINKARFDDHRGILFVQRSALDDEEAEELEKLAPDMHLVVRRFVWPSDKGPGKSRPLAADPQRPPKIGTYVAHSWAEPFADLVQTLQRAFDGEDTVFVPGLMMGSGAVIHGRSGGSGELEHRPFASALRKAERLMVVADRSCAFLHCLWCAFEIMKAKEWLVPTFIWPHHAVEIAKLKDAVGRLDLNAASLIVPSVAAEHTSEPEELRRLLVTAIRGTLPDLEASSRQLRAFLQSRIQCLVCAMQDANEFRDFNPERMRRLCADHERRTTMRETGRETSRRVGELEAEAQERDKALARLRAAVEAEKEARAAEVQGLTQNFEEKMEAAAREEASMRSRHSEVSAGRERAEADLQDARAAIERLQAELEAERSRGQEDRRHLAEARQQAEESSQQAKELGQKLTEEQQRFANEEARLAQVMESQIGELRQERKTAKERAARAEEEAAELKKKLKEVEVALVGVQDEMEQRSNASRSAAGSESKKLGMLSRATALRNSNTSLDSGSAAQSAGNMASALASGAAKMLMGCKQPGKDSSFSAAGDKVAKAAGSLLNPLAAGKSRLGAGFNFAKGVARSSEGTPSAPVVHPQAQADDKDKIAERDNHSDDGGSSCPLTPIITSESSEQASKEAPRRKSAGNAASSAFNFLLKVPSGAASSSPK